MVQSYKTFEYLNADIAICENYIRRFIPRCYATKEDYEQAAAELFTIAQNCSTGFSCKSDDEIKAMAYSEIESSLKQMLETQQELVKSTIAYKETIDFIERIGK